MLRSVPTPPPLTAAQQHEYDCYCTATREAVREAVEQNLSVIQMYSLIDLKFHALMSA